MDFPTAELCAGTAALGLGVSLAIPGARTICHVEREISAASILAARMRDGSIDTAPIWTDLRSFDGRLLRDRVSCIVAGYPCQPFSHAGKRRGREDPRHLWPDVRRIIDESNAPYAFLENVEGHLSLGFREVAGDLRRMGFNGEAGIFSAQEIGAPHLRKRLFILAFRESRGCGELRESLRAFRFSDRRGTRMADAVDGFFPLAGRQPQERAGARPTGPYVANARIDDRRSGGENLQAAERQRRREPPSGGEAAEARTSKRRPLSGRRRNHATTAAAR